MARKNDLGRERDLKARIEQLKNNREKIDRDFKQVTKERDDLQQKFEDVIS